MKTIIAQGYEAVAVAARRVEQEFIPAVAWCLGVRDRIHRHARLRRRQGDQRAFPIRPLPAGAARVDFGDRVTAKSPRLDQEPPSRLGAALASGRERR